MIGFLHALSKLCGWVYFALWSLSFYPQVLLNLRRQATAGTTIDFPFLNVVGFSSYLASTLALYSDPAVRSQFAARNKGQAPTVRLNDVVFALHGLVLSLILVTQFLAPVVLWSFPPSPSSSTSSRRPSRFVLGLTAGSIIGVLTICALVLFTTKTNTNLKNATKPTIDPSTDWCALDVVYALGYVKVLVTLVKYAPQLLANARNRSTDGWSVAQILLDLAGGVLSIAQLAIDCYLLRDWTAFAANPAKFALGQISIFFDILFIIQHYVIYRPRHHRQDSNKTESERRLLLPRGHERRLD